MGADENVWQRPSSVPIPTVWLTYESKKPLLNGIRPRFKIQDFTEEYRKAVEDNILNYFLRDEPLSEALDVINCPLSKNEYMSLARKFLNQKAALIAIVDNWEEFGDENLPKLAGLNLTGVTRSDDKDDGELLKSGKTALIMEALEYIKNLNDPFKYFGVSEYLYAVGLSVDPIFRGHDLGYNILKSRFNLCKALGIPVTVTIFTSRIAQNSAERLGYETLAEVDYDDYKNEKGEIVFKVRSAKSMKLMGIRIP